MTRSEPEIKSLFDNIKGYNGGGDVFRRKREVSMTLLQPDLTSHWACLSHVDPSKFVFYNVNVQNECEEDEDEDNGDDDDSDIYRDFSRKFQTLQIEKRKQHSSSSLEEVSTTSSEQALLPPPSFSPPLTYDNFAINQSTSSVQTRDLNWNISNDNLSKRQQDVMAVNEDVFEEREIKDTKKKTPLVRACSSKENREIEKILREAHIFSTINRTKIIKPQSRLKLLRKPIKEERRPFCEDVKKREGVSMTEEKAYDELVQKPHCMPRHHYSLSDSENMCVCGVDEVMMSRSDGCEVPSLDDQLRFSCESKTHISCHSLPTPELSNRHIIYRQHSLPSYYPTDPPPLPTKTGSKSNLFSHTPSFRNSPPLSLCPSPPSYQLKNCLLSNVPPLPAKASPPIPPKSFNLNKPKKHKFHGVSFKNESLKTKDIKDKNTLIRPPDYYNQKKTNDLQSNESSHSNLPKHTLQPQQSPLTSSRTPHLSLQPLSISSHKHNYQNPFQSSPSFLKSLPSPQKLLTLQIPTAFQLQKLSLQQLPQKQLPPHLLSLPLPQPLSPLQLPPQKLPPPQLPPLQLPLHRTTHPCCHATTSLSLHASSTDTHQHLKHSPPSHLNPSQPHYNNQPPNHNHQPSNHHHPLNHNHHYQPSNYNHQLPNHHHSFTTTPFNGQTSPQMTGRYETSDSLVYEDVNVLSNCVKDLL